MTSTSVSTVTTAGNQWPWMEGAESRIQDPMDPTDKSDKRPAVKDLIKEYRLEIDQLRSAIRDDPLFQPDKHDDLWLVRFLISHKKKHKKALQAAKYTLQFRKEHNLDDHDIRCVDVNAYHNTAPQDTHPFAKAYYKGMTCVQADTCSCDMPDPNRGVIWTIGLAGRDQHRLVKELTEEEHFQGILFSSEWIFQHLDRTTRTTGRLTKCLRIADCKGSEWRMINTENKRRESRVMNSMEDIYPQLMAALLIVNAPTWADLLHKLCKPFMPKRVLDKIDLVDPIKKQKDLQKILDHCALENLPKKFGGTVEGSGFVSRS